MSIYGSWEHEEAHDVGKRFLAKCKANYSYENCLTNGKEYEIIITPAILSLSPLCYFVGDNGKRGECHLERFEKIKELPDERFPEQVCATILDRYKKVLPNTDCSGKCLQFCEILVKEFPDELRLVKGVVTGSNGKEYAHAWCETRECIIIDPTVEQYCNILPLKYKEFKGEATGQYRCANCGKVFFNTEDYSDTTVCSKECHKEYVEYLTKGIYDDD